MKKKRLDYLDMAKGVGAILVLLGHLQGDEFFSLSPYILTMCEWIFSFHMPLFFIISGMLIFHRGDLNKDINDLAKKRFKGIMIPYYWFSLFYLSVVFYAFFSGTVLKETVFENLWYVISTYGMNVLWFLPALFFGELLFIMIMQKVKDKRVGVAIVVLLGAIGLVGAYVMVGMSYETDIAKRMHELCTALLRPLVVATFIMIGYYAQMVSEIIFSEDSKKFVLLSNRVVQIIAGACLMVAGFMLVKINHGVDFRSMVYKNVLSYYACAILNTAGLILVMKGLTKNFVLSFFGVNSLIFMGVHNSKTVLYYAMNAAMYINQYVTRAKGYVSYFVIVMVILIYVAIMILLINNFVPFIIGKSLSSSKIYKGRKS